jgi:hypothetical protein
MILVIKNSQVAAIHEDHQDVRTKYPGCEIIQWDTPYPFDPCGNNPDPRSEEQKASVYRDRRRQVYPSLGDQLDMIYWDQINGTTVWQDTVAAVKAQYPK